MKKILSSLVVGLSLLLPATAGAQDVKVDFDKAYNFAPVKTFSIRIGTTWGNQLGENRVLTEFEAAIVAKGWKKVAEGQGDIVVVLHGATKEKHEASTFYTGMGGGYGAYGYRGWGGGMATASTVVNEYTVGELVVDMFDAKTKGLVFRGIASDELSDKADKNQKKLEKASDKMFKNFPPGSVVKK